MEDEKLSKKELKHLKKLHELESANLEKKQNMMKWIVITVLSIVFLAGFTYVILFAKQQQKTATKPISEVGWVRGDKNAKNTLIEFSDIQCPACRANEPLVAQALKDFDGKVKLVYKHFPLTTVHKHAMEGAIALEAAGAQGKFFEMHDLMFEKQSEWEAVSDAQAKFVEYATSLGLDVDKFKQDLGNKDFQKKINAQEDEGIAAGVDATPTFFMNNVKLDPASSYDDFKRQIESLLKK